MKNFKSPKPMLDWQYRSMLEELNELQRHASDPSCPCVLSDSGEFCLHKHSLGLHTLAKETASMDTPNKGLLETLADEALTQHQALKDRITCGKQHKDEKDTVAWSRQWRKKLEGIYYHAGCPIATHKVSDPGHALTASNVAEHMHFPKDSEKVMAAYTGHGGKVLSISTVSTGGTHSAPLPVEKIVKEAKEAGASGIVLAHNHPSGSLDTSKDDREATIALGQAAKKEGIELVDHVVVGGEHRHSTFKEKGLRVASPIRQKVIFFNPKNGNKKELLTLIDTGAEPSGLPLEVIKELDLSEWGTTTINLATGEERPNTKLYLAGATLLDRTTPVLIAPAGMAILGVHALEMLGLKLNPLGQLKKEPMLFAPILSEHRYTNKKKGLRVAEGITYPQSDAPIHIIHENIKAPELVNMIPPEYRHLTTTSKLLRVEPYDPDKSPQITSPGEATPLFRLIRDAPQEYLMVVLLNTRNRIIGINVMAKGTRDAALVPKDEIFKLAILANASNILLAHNHPSGDPSPSKDDIEIFRDLEMGCTRSDIKLLDFIVIGKTKGYSIKGGSSFEYTAFSDPVLSEHRYTKLEKHLITGLRTPEGKHAAAVICAVEKAVQKHGSEAAHALALRGHIRAQTKPITSTEFNSALKIMAHAQTIPRHGEAEMLSDSNKLKSTPETRREYHLLAGKSPLSLTDRELQVIRTETISFEELETVEQELKRRGRIKYTGLEKTRKYFGGGLSVGQPVPKPSCPQKWVNYVKHGEPVGECGDTPCPVSDKTFAIGPNSLSRYNFKYRLVDVEKLQVSHNPMTFVPNPNYPQELQPRDRTRAADQAQVIVMAAKLDPEVLLVEFHSIDRGAPIIGADNIVESGNGRVMAIQRAIEEAPKSYQKYLDALKVMAPKYAIPGSELTKYKYPILVRERLTKVDRATFGKESNLCPTLGSSPIETARADASLLRVQDIFNLEIGENQGIDDALRAASNQGFVKAFLAQLELNQRATIVDAEGKLNQEGIRRLTMAMFVRAFPGDTGLRLAEKFFESTGETVKNVLNGILKALGRLAQAEALVANGQRSKDLSIADDLTKAVNIYARIKADVSGMTVAKYLAQMQLQARELTPFQENLLTELDKRSRSGKAIGEMLNAYAQAVLDSSPPSQGGLLDLPPLTKEDLWATALRRSELVAVSEPFNKQPWEMPRSVYSVGIGWGEQGINPAIIHRNSVIKALSEGKPVPPEVLADYPDLAAKYETSLTKIRKHILWPHGSQMKLLDPLGRYVDLCNLSAQDQGGIWNYRPLREFIMFVSGKGEVQICNAGFVPGSLQITIKGLAKGFSPYHAFSRSDIEKRAKGVQGLKLIDAKDDNTELVYTILLPRTEATSSELLGGQQFVEGRTVHGETGKQTALFDPLLSAPKVIPKEQLGLFGYKAPEHPPKPLYSLEKGASFWPLILYNYRKEWPEPLAIKESLKELFDGCGTQAECIEAALNFGQEQIRFTARGFEVNKATMQDALKILMLHPELSPWATCPPYCPTPEPVVVPPSPIIEQHFEYQDKYKLFPFQSEGVAWLRKQTSALLADDMGLGKTPQAIHWAAEHRPVLVVVPSALLLNWEREIKTMWRPMDKVLLLLKGAPIPKTLPDWTIVSYNSLNNYINDLRKAGFNSIVIDEAHLVKNLETQRTKNVLNLISPEEPRATDRPIRYRLAVTGTPILNRPIELFPLFIFIGKKRRDDLRAFMEQYTDWHMIRGRRVFTASKNLNELHGLLKEFMLRRLKGDVLKQLPPKIHTPLFVPISNADEYKRVEIDFLNWLREKAGNEAALRAASAEIITKMNALRQLAALGKVKPMADWLKPCGYEGQGKVLVFSSFKEPLLQLQTLKPASFFYSGELQPSERQQIVDKFQVDAKYCYFFGTIGASGVGITLTAANRVAFLDLPWTPGGKLQAEDRAHRIGQKQAVEIVDFIAKGTIDERMLELLAEKEQIIAQAVDGKSKDEATKDSVAQSVINSFLYGPSVGDPIQYQAEVFDPEVEHLTEEQVNILQGVRDPSIALTPCEKAHHLGPKLERCVQKIAAKPTSQQPVNKFAVCRASISGKVCGS